MQHRGLLVLLPVLLTCTPPTPWSPGTVLPTPEGANARGFLDRRGLVHAHSVYSHDACDGEPEKDGVRDADCFEDFRRDLCTVQHDFVFLTDHRDAFTRFEFPDVLLFKPERGDVLVERGGVATANRAACPKGRGALVMAGTEAATMPVGLEGHATAMAARDALYGRDDAEAIAAFKAKGAVVLVAHTEDWSPDTLATLPLDGFEMYNLHANTFLGMGKVLRLLTDLVDGREGMTHPDLSFLHVQQEDPAYLSRWGSVLARGVKRVTTMGTDCHRNTFKDLMQDGERVDSYRRMMSWFSNHLLVKPDAGGAWDDRHLKDALRAGRLYGSFDVLGYPDGFDFHARGGGTVHEMGAEVPVGAELRVALPKVANLDPEVTPPALEVRLLRAIEEGWEQVTTGSGDLAFTTSVAGAYRAEVRMVPHHLVAFLGEDPELMLRRDYVWIYSNAMYVR